MAEDVASSVVEVLRPQLIAGRGRILSRVGEADLARGRTGYKSSSVYEVAGQLDARYGSGRDSEQPYLSINGNRACQLSDYIKPRESMTGMLQRLVDGAEDGGYTVQFKPSTRSRGGDKIEILSIRPGGRMHIPLYDSRGVNAAKKVAPADPSFRTSVMRWIDALSDNNGKVSLRDVYSVADRSGYRDPSEIVCFANRLARFVVRGEGIRPYDDRFLSTGIGVPKSMLGHADDMVTSASAMVDEYPESGHGSRKVLRTVDVVPVALHDAYLLGRNPNATASEQRMDFENGTLRFESESDLNRFLRGVDAMVQAETSATLGRDLDGGVLPDAREQVRETPQDTPAPQAEERSVARPKAHPVGHRWQEKAAKSVSAWLDAADRAGVSLDADLESRLKAYASGEDRRLYLAFEDAHDLERGMGLSEGTWNRANAPVSDVYSDQARRSLGEPSALCDVYVATRGAGRRMLEYDERHNSAHFESNRVDISDFDGRIERMGLGEFGRRMVIATIRNGANQDLEEMISESFGVPTNGAVADLTSASIVDAALGLRNPPDSWTIEECQDTLVDAARDWIAQAPGAEVAKRVSVLFDTKGYHYDIADCTPDVLARMEANEPSVEHLQVSEVGEDGKMHGSVMVDDVIFVEDGDDMHAYPIYADSDVDRAWRLLSALQNGLDDAKPVPPERRRPTPKADTTISSKTAGSDKPVHVRGHWRLHTEGPKNSRYRIIYQAAYTRGGFNIDFEPDRVYRVSDKGVLSKGSFLDEMGAMVERAGWSAFERTNEMASRDASIERFGSIDDVIVPIHTDHPDMFANMTKAHTGGVKFSIIDTGASRDDRGDNGGYDGPEM